MKGIKDTKVKFRHEHQCLEVESESGSGVELRISATIYAPPRSSLCYSEFREKVVAKLARPNRLAQEHIKSGGKEDAAFISMLIRELLAAFEEEYGE